MQKIRRDDARIQRRTETVEAGKGKLPIDNGFVRKAAAGAATILRLEAHSSPAAPALVQTSRG
jgi:hypothetical protein